MQLPINDTFKAFMAHVGGHVEKGHPLPFRATSRLGLALVDKVLRIGQHAGRMVENATWEAGQYNKRKIVGPVAGAVAGAGTGVGVAAITAAVAGGALSGPAAGVIVGAGLAVGLAALAVQQGIRVANYHGARKDIDDWGKEHPLDQIEINKLFDAVNLGGLSELTRSFEKAWEAHQEFYRMAGGNLEVLKSDVGRAGTCFKAAEHAYRLLYWFKRARRLFHEGPEGYGDHRLRNVKLFVKLVPQSHFAQAEVALAKYGRDLVNFLAEEAPQLPSTGTVRLQNEGFLKWADWAVECSDAPKDHSANAKWRVRVASLAKEGRAVGDPKGLVAKWGSLVEESHIKGVGENKRAELANEAPFWGQSGSRPLVAQLKNQFQLPGLGLTGARPVTVLVVKKCLDDLLLNTAISGGAAWATSGISACVAGVVSPLVSLFSTMAAEAINSWLNLREIFKPSTHDAMKVRLIRDNLEAGGAAEVKYLGERIKASIDALNRHAKYLGEVGIRGDPVKSMVIELYRSMVIELYRLHQYVVRLAVQSVLWELLLALILGWREKSREDLRDAYTEFERLMKERLGSNTGRSYHANCWSACYRIDDKGNPVDPLFKA
jgi:hypothetical protein